MPSKKPAIQFHTDEILIKKMKYISEYHNRSMSKEIEYICKMHILKFESENGTIDTSGSQETWGI